jgi:hypothetical protein
MTEEVEPAPKSTLHAFRSLLLSRFGLPGEASESRTYIVLGKTFTMNFLGVSISWEEGSFSVAPNKRNQLDGRMPLRKTIALFLLGKNCSPPVNLESERGRR